MASGVTQKDDIRKFEEIGTHPALTLNATLSEALIFNDNIGIDPPTGRASPLSARPLGAPSG